MKGLMRPLSLSFFLSLTDSSIRGIDPKDCKSLIASLRRPICSLVVIFSKRRGGKKKRAMERKRCAEFKNTWVAF